MMTTKPRNTSHAGLDARLLVGLAFLIGVVIMPAVTRAETNAELIPSFGVSKPVHDDTAEAQTQWGLAVRGQLGSIFKPEIGVAYREESRFDDQLRLRSWPVTASMWVAPVRVLYVGGGVGWYHTTYDYEDALLIPTSTTQNFGVHLGGGLEVPISRNMALDLNGRYVFLQKEGSELPPGNFDPDFWTTSLGLAVRL